LIRTGDVPNICSAIGRVWSFGDLVDVALSLVDVAVCVARAITVKPRPKQSQAHQAVIDADPFPSARVGLFAWRFVRAAEACQQISGSQI
jgi:hypothetical protein